MNQSNERITEIEQTRNILNKAREVYFNFNQSQKKQKMAHTKIMVKKRMVREDCRSGSLSQIMVGKVPRIGKKGEGKQRKSINSTLE